MDTVPLTTAAAVRQALRTVEPEFYDDSIPVSATQRRMLVMTEAAAHVIVNHCGKLPEHQTQLLTRAMTVIITRRNLRAARDLINEALEIVPGATTAHQRPQAAY